MCWSGKAAQHDADHRQTHEGCNDARVSLEIASQATVAANPSESSLDDPTLGQHDELVQFAALDDFDAPMTRTCGGLRHARSLIAGIGEDALDEGKEAARASIENQPRTIAILHVGGMNDDVQEKAERIDKDVPLAARDLLACIEALRVERGAPF
jgi:hypothetical protein